METVNDVANRYVQTEVTRLGLRTWLVTSPYQASIEAVKNTLRHERVDFTAEEVFVNNAYAIEITLLRQV